MLFVTLVHRSLIGVIDFISSVEEIQDLLIGRDTSGATLTDISTLKNFFAKKSAKKRKRPTSLPDQSVALYFKTPAAPGKREPRPQPRSRPQVVTHEACSRPYTRIPRGRQKTPRPTERRAGPQSQPFNRPRLSKT